MSTDSGIAPEPFQKIVDVAAVQGGANDGCLVQTGVSRQFRLDRRRCRDSPLRQHHPDDLDLSFGAPFRAADPLAPAAINRS